jgi:Bacterial antitoxin of type II TA system, VapB
MRTTIDLEQPLLRRARQRAAASGTTLSRLVQEALRSYLQAQARKPTPNFELITCGTVGGRCPTPIEIQNALHDDDAAALRMPGVRDRADP